MISGGIARGRSPTPQRTSPGRGSARVRARPSAAVRRPGRGERRGKLSRHRQACPSTSCLLDSQSVACSDACAQRARPAYLTAREGDQGCRWTKCTARSSRARYWRAANHWSDTEMSDPASFFGLARSAAHNPMARFVTDCSWEDKMRTVGGRELAHLRTATAPPAPTACRRWLS